MNTHGHQSVAEDAGIPLLEAAFMSSLGRPRVTAFYLGNWIADLSQVNDPVAIARARDKIGGYVAEVFEFLRTGVTRAKGWHSLLEPLGQTIGPIDRLRDQVIGCISAVFTSMITSTPPERSPWFKAVQPGVLLKGYFKFVQPMENVPPQMDLAAYVAVFEELFEQYYPYEHMDRPDHPNPQPAPKDRVHYDDRMATGPRNAAASVTAVPDLYWYLRDYLHVIAGRLTDLDLRWASQYAGTTAVRDDDVDWNRGLARLGQAIHGVEDFFAHSNFIEHAATVLGRDYHTPDRYQFIDYRRFKKRLKRYNFLGDPDDWEQNADETYVVTGYFDFRDTLFSLWHLVEESLPGFRDQVDVTKPMRLIVDGVVRFEKTDAKVNRTIDDVVESFLEILNDPKTFNAANKDNEIVAAIQKAVEKSFLNDIAKLIDALQHPKVGPELLAQFEVLFEAMPLFRDLQALAVNKDGRTPVATSKAAAKILAAFVDFTGAMLVQVRAGKAFLSLYEVLKTVTEFSAAPMLYLEKELPKTLAIYLAKGALYFAKETFYEAAGLERIGCHSLICKDHGNEALYDKMNDCAIALHYYIVKTMMRWRKPVSVPPDREWVDWLELLEFFTMHPTAGVVCTVPVEVVVTKVHVLTDADRSAKTFDELLEKLARQYAPLTLMPSGTALDARKILHANSSVKFEKLNYAAVLESALARLVLGPLAVPFGLRRIVIPYVRQKMMVCDPAAVSPRWYMTVMNSDWRAIKTKNPHVLRFHPTQQKAATFRTVADQLRRELELFDKPALP